MAVVANRRSVMTLFSRPTDIHSHRARLVLAEKGLELAYHIPPEIPDRIFDITDFGAAGDGASDCTTPIARAVEACAAAGGGRRWW